MKLVAGVRAIGKCCGACRGPILDGDGWEVHTAIDAPLRFRHRSPCPPARPALWCAPCEITLPTPTTHARHLRDCLPGRRWWSRWPLAAATEAAYGGEVGNPPSEPYVLAVSVMPGESETHDALLGDRHRHTCEGCGTDYRCRRPQCAPEHKWCEPCATDQAVNLVSGKSFAFCAVSRRDFPTARAHMEACWCGAAQAWRKLPKCVGCGIALVNDHPTQRCAKCYAASPTPVDLTAAAPSEALLKEIKEFSPAALIAGQSVADAVAAAAKAVRARRATPAPRTHSAPPAPVRATGKRGIDLDGL